MVTLTLSRGANYGYDQRCEVFGTSGLAAVTNQHENSSELHTATMTNDSLREHFISEVDSAKALNLTHEFHLQKNAADALNLTRDNNRSSRIQSETYEETIMHTKQVQARLLEHNELLLEDRDGIRARMDSYLTQSNEEKKLCQELKTVLKAECDYILQIQYRTSVRDQTDEESKRQYHLLQQQEA